MLSVRIPKDIEEKLEKIAKKTERSKSYFVNKALKQYFEDLEDYMEAHSRFMDNQGSYITTKELKEQLGLS
jgi:RHH-type rel operon transcriptional repressor/antitoxin RelB